MTGDSTFCCLPIDIAVRLIGTISLLTNALVFIALVSDADEVITDDKVRIIFGFDSQFFVKGDQAKDWFPVFCLVYTLMAAISSALLIWASIIAQKWLTIPWLMCSLFNIISHFTSLVMLSLTRFSSIDKWAAAFTVFYSVTILYFVIVVMAADYMWCVQSKEQFNYQENQEPIFLLCKSFLIFLLICKIIFGISHLRRDCTGSFDLLKKTSAFIPPNSTQDSIKEK